MDFTLTTRQFSGARGTLWLLLRSGGNKMSSGEFQKVNQICDASARCSERASLSGFSMSGWRWESPQRFSWWSWAQGRGRWYPTYWEHSPGWGPSLPGNYLSTWWRSVRGWGHFRARPWAAPVQWMRSSQNMGAKFVGTITFGTYRNSSHSI